MGEQPSFRLGNVVAGTVVLLFLTQVYGWVFFRTPTYFSVLDIATVSDRDISTWGLFFRVLLPWLTGLFLGLWSEGYPQKEAAISGFMASLLQSWPVLYFPHLRPFLLPSSLVMRPVLTLTVYAMFIISYSVLSYFGAISALYYLGLKEQGRIRSISPTLKDLVLGIIAGLITNLIWIHFGRMLR